MGLDIAGALTGAVEGFLMTGNPIGAGVMALEGAMNGGSGGTSLAGALGPDTVSSDSGPSSLMAFSQLAELAG